MKILHICKTRRSVRTFTGEPIADDEKQYIMEAARWAATSRNRQARRFVYVQDSERIAGIVQQAEMQDFVSGASVLVFGLAADKENRGAFADVIISMSQMEMAAVELGLGTIWLGIWNGDVVEDIFNNPPDLEVVTAMAIGPPAGEGRPKDKMPVEKLFRKNSLGEE